MCADRADSHGRGCQKSYGQAGYGKRNSVSESTFLFPRPASHAIERCDSSMIFETSRITHTFTHRRSNTPLLVMFTWRPPTPTRRRRRAGVRKKRSASAFAFLRSSVGVTGSPSLPPSLPPSLRREGAKEGCGGGANQGGGRGQGSDASSILRLHVLKLCLDLCMT